ncbi:MAG TPA: hypothetical protein VGA37_07255 [Gemmatimonadales bacterium]
MRVAGTRDIGSQARKLTTRPLPPGLRARVLQSVASGVPVIVPVADPVVAALPWRKAVWVGVGALVLVAGIRVVGVRNLESETSLLEFAPAGVPEGGTVSITYHATARFGSARSLKLRARYRRAGDPQYGYDIPQVDAATLTRTSGRTYRGNVALPDRVVYAAFAVEDDAGVVIDSRGVQGWEWLAQADGRPTSDALLQRVNEAFGRDPGAALDAAIELTGAFPERVEGWNTRTTLERAALGPDVSSRLRDGHVQRVRAFHAELQDSTIPASEIGAMYSYAKIWDVADIAEWWRRRVLRDTQGSALDFQLRLVDIYTARRDDPAKAAQETERLWDDIGSASGDALALAFGLALQLKQPQASLRWARRLLAAEPHRRLAVAEQLGTFSTLRDTVRTWLDEEAARLARPDDSRRPLYVATRRQDRAREDLRSGALALKGRLLLDAGDTVAAGAYLDSAAALGWDVANFTAAAQLRLARGDSVGAARLYALVAVDPGAGGAEIEGLGRRLVGARQWEAEKVRALAQMVERTGREAEPRAVFDLVRVTDRDGMPLDLRARLAGPVTVVAFWVPLCKTCLTDLRDTYDLVTGFGPAARIAIVSQRALTEEDWNLLASDGLDGVAVVDAFGDATRAFSAWGAPATFVVDGRAVIQYRLTSADKLARQILTLVDRKGQRTPVVAP